MHKTTGERGPMWFKGDKKFIQNLKPQSNKMVDVQCPMCKCERQARFYDITRAGHTFCKGCAKIWKNFLEVKGEKFGRLTVESLAEPFTEPDGTRLTVVNCLCECGNTTTVRLIALTTNHTTSCGCYQSEVTSELMSQRVGPNHPNYNHEMSEEARKKLEKERQSPEYRAWEKAVKKKFGHKCFRCDSTKDLVAHHIFGFTEYPSLRYEIDNGVCLCENCHTKFHIGYLGNWNITATKQRLVFWLKETWAEVGRNWKLLVEDAFGA